MGRGTSRIRGAEPRLTDRRRQSKPAGGAAIGEVVGATAGAVIPTALLFGSARHRRAAKCSSRAADPPPHLRPPGLGRAAVGIASVSLLVALFGMYWDISLHIDEGRDEGPLANPAHYFILIGLFGIFAAGFLAIVLPREKPSRAPWRSAATGTRRVGGVLICAAAPSR